MEFNRASIFSRFSTVVAGPLANFVFSIVIFCTIFLIQGVTTNDPIVGKINKFYEANYDLQVNDQILEVEGRKVKSFADIFSHTHNADRETLSFKIKRNDFIKEITLPHLMQPIVEAIEPLSAASLAGLQIGDVFLTLEEKS